jgi:hypothetical protein
MLLQDALRSGSTSLTIAIAWGVARTAGPIVHTNFGEHDFHALR